MLHIYYGDGKGKTSSAIGLSIRYAGTNKKVMFVQFLKNNKSNERKILDIIDNIFLYPCPENVKFVFDMTNREKTDIYQQYNHIFTDSFNIVISQNYDMIVFDELNCVIDNNLIDIDIVKSYISEYKNKKEIILTGYALPNDLVNLADYISNIQKVKHPFDSGISARLGVEY